jgi:hypothetical protein
MPPETSFIERLQSHVGGLVRVLYTERRREAARQRPLLRLDDDVIGKIGLLLRSESRLTLWHTVVKVELLIDGKIKELILLSGDLEFIGADDAS